MYSFNSKKNSSVFWSRFNPGCDFFGNVKLRLFQKRLLFFILLLLINFSISGCSQPVSSDTSTAEVQVVDEDTMVISKLTDGILNCLATNRYQWLKNYAVSDLNGPQVARVLVGDAAFDQNITKWNISKIEIIFSNDKKAAFVSIPVTHIARVNPKQGAKTSIFNFQFIYSAQHQRWLLNIK